MPLALLVALNAFATIIKTPAPTNRKAEHLRQHRERAVGIDRSARAELVVPTINLGMGDRRDLRPAENGQDVGGNLILVDSLRRGAFAWQVILLETLAQVGD